LSLLRLKIAQNNFFYSFFANTARIQPSSRLTLAVMRHFQRGQCGHGGVQVPVGISNNHPPKITIKTLKTQIIQNYQSTHCTTTHTTKTLQRTLFVSVFSNAAVPSPDPEITTPSTSRESMEITASVCMPEKKKAKNNQSGTANDQWIQFSTSEINYLSFSLSLSHSLSLPLFSRSRSPTLEYVSAVAGFWTPESNGSILSRCAQKFP
jgi:hypothetical protein